MPTSWRLSIIVRAQVLVVVHRRHREVALLGARLVAEVRALVARRCSTTPRRSRPGTTTSCGVVSKRTSSNTKNSGSGPKYAESAMPVEKRCSCGLLGDVAGVAGVALAGDRVADEAVHDERAVLAERVEVATCSGRARGSCPTPGSPGSRAPTSRRRGGRPRTGASVSFDAGIDTCCITPGRSQKRKSTISTSCSSTVASTSAGSSRPCGELRDLSRTRPGATLPPRKWPPARSRVTV